MPASSPPAKPPIKVPNPGRIKEPTAPRSKVPTPLNAALPMGSPRAQERPNSIKAPRIGSLDNGPFTTLSNCLVACLPITDLDARIHFACTGLTTLCKGPLVAREGGVTLSDEVCFGGLKLFTLLLKELIAPVSANPPIKT